MAANPIAPKIVGIIGSANAGPTFGLQLLSHPILASRFKSIIFDKSAALPSSSSDKGHGSILPSAGAAVALFSNGLFPLYNLNLRAPLDVASSEMSCLTLHKLTWNQELQTGARAIERQTLQRLLVSEYLQRGGEVQWGKNAVSFSRQDSGQIRVLFSDGTDAVVDLLVGADGGFSTVRKFILNERNPSTAEARWLPDFMGMSGFYGISTPTQALAETRADPQTKESTHAIWLDNGNLSVAPLPDGKVRWDLMISEKTPPDSTGPVEPSSAETSDSSEPWETAIMPGMYPRSSSVEVLRKHAEIYHPVVETFGKLLESAERIIRSPLRQRVWTEEEIQYENVALIGDAARLMLPSSGQGTGFAVEDATVLANTLLNHTSAGGAVSNIRAALEEYAVLRVPRSKKMALVASIAGRVGIGEQWYLRALRDWVRELRVKQGKESWPFNERLKFELARN
ncbi:hypothetical protein DFH08DRAFT_922079 [Mycena albidolilacea]|uniref:FAD-binding domain-containing protein n=1 Tax=Mycena albidolilacea TaxID=1033008 RepID=A0AAD7AEK9_9AGAR|nr:hypothetical protein DFH08DRAFT_922079 [Mycena albidolilacea]